MTSASASSSETASATVATQPGADRPDVERPAASDRLPLIAISRVSLELRKAWATYLLLALIPPSAMIASIFALLFIGDGRDNSGVATASLTDGGMPWLLVGLTFIGLAVPLAFWYRRTCWASYYVQGQVVEPENYLKGWLAVWIPLVLGGVFGFVALAITGEFSVVFISMLAFVVFLSMTPNGHAMTRPVGHEDDPAVYEEPK